MSSYQFTLAQCYAAEQSGSQTNSQASGTSQDYYNMNYPNCYSPNLAAHSQYGQYSLMMGASATPSINASSSEFLQRGSANESPSSSTTQAQASCKFTNVTSSAVQLNEGSPQDLSRNSDPETSKTPDSRCLSPAAPEASSPSSGSEHQASTAESAAGENSGNNSVKNAQGKNDGKSSTNPPQIYPWMKRVHLGQSKSFS